MAASSSMAFQPSLPCFRELLSLLARLHGYPHVGLRCTLEIQILFNNLSLQLSDFQSPSEHWSSLSNAALNAVMETEGQMHADDKRQVEKAKARNAVEKYIYGMKDKLETVYKEFISEQDKEQLLRLLNDTEDWLYEEGETKIVYNKKLEELKKHGDPIFKKVKEFEGRSAAFDNLGAVVVHHDRKLTQYKAGNEELAHVPAEEMQKVEEAVHKKQQWMHEQLQKFENLPKSTDPPITIAQICDCLSKNQPSSHLRFCLVNKL